MAVRLFDSISGLFQKNKHYHRYSSMDLAESCNISVTAAESIISRSNLDENDLSLEQFERLRSQITRRAGLFSDAFNECGSSSNETGDPSDRLLRDMYPASNPQKHHHPVLRLQSSNPVHLDAGDNYQDLIPQYFYFPYRDRVIVTKAKQQQSGQTRKRKRRTADTALPLNTIDEHTSPPQCTTSTEGQGDAGNPNKKTGLWSLELELDIRGNIIVHVQKSHSPFKWRKIICPSDLDRNSTMPDEYKRLSKLMVDGDIKYGEPNSMNLLRVSIIHKKGEHTIRVHFLLFPVCADADHQISV